MLQQLHFNYMPHVIVTFLFCFYGKSPFTQRSTAMDKLMFIKQFAN